MANPNTYDKGDVVRVSGTFRNEAGALTDPTTVTLRVKSPSATTVYTYPADIIRGSVGVFRRDIVIDVAGAWFYKFEGTGAVQAAEETRFTISPSAF